ncbi:MAG: response regulator, partial [Planctomycetota bacterium]|nr:response regulator [Planctomycetota bacterium]
MSKESKKQKPRVVVIDDDEVTCLSISQMLRLRGYSISSFCSAEDALGWSGLADVDCIVTDVKMPRMDGERFLAEVIRRSYKAPVVMITGHGDISMAVRCLKAGAYDFVEKPFNDEVLVASVRRGVEKAALLRESEELHR